jgi:hypothetical protein
MNHHDLIQAVQNHTGFPWINGEQYASFVGYTQQSIHIRSAVDDIDDLIEWMRKEKAFEFSDRLRVIRDRLNTAHSLTRCDAVK